MSSENKTDEKQPESTPVTIELDSGSKHWLQVRDWAEDNIDKLKERLKELETRKKEAEEQLFEGVAGSWDYLKIDGQIVYARVEKPGQRRVYIDDLKAAHPDIYDELLKSKPVEKIERVK